MADVELVIRATNEPYVNSVRGAQKATQELHNTVERGTKREKGLIEDIENELTKLQEKRRKAFTVEDIEKYNRKLAEAKKDLKDYEQAGVKANEEIKKSSDKLSEALGGSIKKWLSIGTAIALATKLVKSITEALKDTVAGMNAITIASEIWKQFAYNIATANLNMGDFTRTMASAIAVGRMINEQRKEDRKDLVLSSQLREDYNRLYFESADRTQSLETQMGKLNEAQDVHNKMIDIELENAQRNLAIIEVQLVNRPKSNKLLDEEAKLLAQINSIEGQRFSETKRVEMRRTGLEKEIRDRDMKQYIDWIEERVKRQEDFQKLSLKLLEDYDKSQIESFTGKKKLVAQRDFGIKQIKEIRDQLALLGTLSAEQKQMLQVMADNVWKEYYQALSEDAGATKATSEQQEAISGALLGNMPELQGLIRKDVKKLGEQIAGEAATRTETPFSIWKLLGIDTESDEGKEAIEGVKDAASKISDALSEALEQRVEIAQRERELLDTKIAETQRELEFEQQLRNEGFANNVSARQKYLEDLKAQREKALDDEEKAVKQEQLMGKITQTTNILSGVSNIISTFSKIPIVGLVLAAAAVASLWAIWRGAKSQTESETKLAEGGSGTDRGIVTGRRHSRGGERFLDHVNVEHGEAFGVLSRQATGKYGKVFHEMVSSFNRDQMPQFLNPAVTNTVRVDNNGPNTRLDKVISEQKKLNESLSKQSQTYTIGSRRIIRRGNKTRIIG